MRRRARRGLARALLATILLALFPALAAAQPVTRGSDDERLAAVRALEEARADRTITAAFVFRMGEERVVLFADAGDRREAPCESPVPAFHCDPAPEPDPPTAGLARLTGGLEMILEPRPFVRFDWDLWDTDGDGDSELVVVLERGPGSDMRGVDEELLAFGAVAGNLALRARIPLAGGAPSECGPHGYWTDTPPLALKSEEGRVIRIRYRRGTRTADCQDLGSPEGPTCGCEETVLIVDFALRENGTMREGRLWHPARGPFRR